MAKKIEINEEWEPVEVEDLDNLFVVIFKHGSFDQGYVEAFDTDDILMQSAYDSLANQYDDCGCDELTKIYLIKVPNTDQTVNMCNTGLFNGNCCDPHVIEATRDLFNRADCEHLSCWEGCGLIEAKKKKKKPYSSSYCGFTDPDLNIKHFNKCMGTDNLQSTSTPNLATDDAVQAAQVTDAGSTDGADGAGNVDTGSSTGESGAVGESLNEDVTKELQIQDNENIEKDIEELDPPIDPGYFPNNMGINLCSVKKEIWVQQDDGQLKSIEVEFDPAEKVENGLDEATNLNYYEQKNKMKALDDKLSGRDKGRGFNTSNVSLDKLLFNYDICIDCGYDYARKFIEDTLRAKGWGQYIKQTKKQVKISDYDIILKPDYINIASVKAVLANKDNVQQLIKDYNHSLTALLIIIIVALCLKETTLAGEIKDYIINNFTVTLAELKDFLTSYFSNKAATSALRQVINACKNDLTENIKLDEAKRYVKRYYVRPLNIFCGNKEDIIQALIRAGDQNCSVYSLKRLTDHEDVHLLQPSDIIYYWDDRVLYDKNHVQVMDYDLFVKHEEERKKVGNVDAISDAAFGDIYDDRATKDDLKDKEVIANYKALNKITR